MSKYDYLILFTHTDAQEATPFLWGSNGTQIIEAKSMSYRCTFVVKNPSIGDRLMSKRSGSTGSGWYMLWGVKNVIKSEIEIVPLVPTLTSNTGSDGGEVIYNSLYVPTGGNTKYSGYGAFDNDNNTAWARSTSGTSGGAFIGYKFTKPTKVTNVLINGGLVSNTIKAKIQYSDDGSTWLDSSTDIILTKNAEHSFAVIDSGYHLCWRLYYISATSDTRYATTKLQFYGYQMEALVPTISSITDSTGQCIGAGGEIYYAFDGKESTTYNIPTPATETRTGYKFNNDKSVSVAFIKTGYAYNATLQYSDNGTNWYNASETIITIANVNMVLNSTENKKHKYWAIRLTISNDTSNFYTKVIQFYAEPESASAGVGSANLKTLEISIPTGTIVNNGTVSVSGTLPKNLDSNQIHVSFANIDYKENIQSSYGVLVSRNLTWTYDPTTGNIDISSEFLTSGFNAELGYDTSQRFLVSYVECASAGTDIDLNNFNILNRGESGTVPKGSKEIIGVWTTRHAGILSDITLSGTPVKSFTYKIYENYYDGSAYWNIGIVHGYLNGDAGLVTMSTTSNLGQGYTNFSRLMYN